jgi:single-strand DNA-binding protein
VAGCEGDIELASVNKIIVIGNVGRDPELRYTANGKSMVQFSLATNHSYQRPDGEWEEQTEWFRIIAWNQLAERVMERIQKGSQAYVEGRLQTRTWTGQDGKERKEVEIIANQILRLDRRGEPMASGVGAMGGSRRGVDDSDIVDPDDLPFD